MTSALEAADGAPFGLATPCHRRVVWMSHGYGYGGDLLYFRRVFCGFRLRFPETRIFVDRLTIDRNPDLRDLWVEAQFMRIRIRRKLQGVPYETEVKFPNPGIVLRLLRLAPAVTIVIEFTPTAIMGMLVAKLVRSKVLLLIESDPKYRGGSTAAPWRWVKSWFARRADLVLTNNAIGKNHVIGVLGVPEERVMAAPYLTSTAAVGGPRPVQRSDAALVTFLFMNSLTERKGVNALLAAMLQLPADVRDRVRLRVVGDGPLAAQARRFVADNGLARTVEFVGSAPYDRIGEELAASDVFISPTFGDYRSLTGFEALSAGLPVIMSKFDGAHHEVVCEGENGFVIDPEEPWQIAEAMTWFVRNADRIPDMAALSRDMSRQFGVSEAVGNLTSAVCRILGEAKEK